MRSFLKLALCSILCSSYSAFASELWQETDIKYAPQEYQQIHPDAYKVFTLDQLSLHNQMWQLSSMPENGSIIRLPMPDGSMREFNVWETPMLPSGLAERFQEIKTFTATAVDNELVTAKLDFTEYGFHAMVYDGALTCFIDPFDNFGDGFYLAYYKKDLSRPADKRMKCMVQDDDDLNAGSPTYLTNNGLPGLAQKTVNGYQLKTYRLALSCSSQYATTVTGVPSPTKAQVLSKMTTTMNRVNGVYEREFSLTMTFVTNENNLIFVSSVGDPFFAINSNASALLSANQTQCNSIIGAANYDIGHVLTTGAGGLATLGCVCSTVKAQGTTGSTSPAGDGFDIDYVAHEMGHQYGSNHTFNDGVNGSCAGGNAYALLSYEPGSGSTIMAYAGICAPDNVQSHSDAYFHTGSIQKILTYINSFGNCATQTPTGNKLVGYTPLAVTSYSIPYMTPFELTAPKLIDSLPDSAVLYCWEQFDLGGIDFSKTFANTMAAGPIFRSMNPTATRVRVFPRMTSVVAGHLDYLYEKVPTVARDMHFICPFRNIRNNKGCVTIPDEMITLHAVVTGTGDGFKVTSQSTTGISYTGGSTQTITWDKANTNAAPVNASHVDITMSVDGGLNWPYVVGTFPNTGTASVTVPNPPTTVSGCRFKVKGSGNVFFNVNMKNFIVSNNPSLPVSPETGVASTPEGLTNVKLFPVPASDVLHIETPTSAEVEIYDATGRMVWGQAVSGSASIDVSSWPRAAYFAHITYSDNTTATRQILVR